MTGATGHPEPAGSAAARVAATVRMLARMGFVHAFGHVSARLGGRILITPTAPPLILVREGDVLDGAGSAADLPLETPLHLAMYERREDVAAICRVHAPAVAAWSTTGEPPPLLHGFGGMVEPVAAWADPALVADVKAAGQVAETLGDGLSILLRGNGGLVVGGSLQEAAVRAWCLEDRCRVALAAAGRGRPFTESELAARARWYPAEVERLWQWLVASYGDDLTA